MSGAKVPDFDAYGLFRAAHSHNPEVFLIDCISKMISHRTDGCKRICHLSRSVAAK